MLFNPAGLTPGQFGITPELAMRVQGANGSPTMARFADRRVALREQWRRQHGYNQQAMERSLLRAFAAPAPPDVRTAAQHHWISRVLDTSNTNGGNILPRVDIEDMLTAVLLQEFPFWAMVNNGPANGLLHTYNIVSASGTMSDSTRTLATETTTITANTSVYAQKQTTNVATFAEMRGVSFKEQYAVSQSGMTYDPEITELQMGLVAMKDTIQRELLQGNFSQSSGTATSEYGAYNAYGIDGLRMITGGLGPYTTTPNILDVDKVNKTIAQGINTVAARAGNRGAHPSWAVLSNTATAAFMDEQQALQRVVDKSEIMPGVTVKVVNTVAGDLPLLPVPGINAIGTYNRTSDGTAVEDIYVLDRQHVYRRWLGGPDINVLEIPAGVGNVLTRTFLVFHFGTLEVRDIGTLQGKARIPQTLS